MPQKITKQSNKIPTNYENNPFFIAANGLTLLVQLALGVAVFMAFLSVINFISSGFSNKNSDLSLASWNVNPDKWSGADQWLLVGSCLLIGLAIAMIYALINGVSAYTSYRISQNKPVTLVEAFRVSFDKLWSFLWLQVIITVKIVLWTLLFVVPGIIMLYRYSLANVAFFDERKKLRGNSAIKESLRLTKGAWITTFASKTLLDMLSLGSLSFVVSTATNAVLYRQFDKLGNAPKPEAHLLSWVTLVFPFVLVSIGIFIFLGYIAGVGLGTAK